MGKSSYRLAYRPWRHCHTDRLEDRKEKGKVGSTSSIGGSVVAFHARDKSLQIGVRMAKGFRVFSSGTGKGRIKRGVAKLLAACKRSDGSDQDDRLPSLTDAALRLVSGNNVSSLYRPGITPIHNGDTFNVLIYDGERVVLDATGKALDVLPYGVGPSVKETQVEYALDRMADILVVSFHNGHTARVELETRGSVDEEKLMEFRATCLMVHDL